MFKKIVLMSVSLFLVACSSNPTKTSPFAPYGLVDDSYQEFSSEKKYKLGSVDFELLQRVENEKFPTREGLKEIFSSNIVAQLKEQNLYSDDGITLDVDMSYRRVFSGEAFGFSKGFAQSECEYTNELLIEDNVVARHSPGKLLAIKQGWFGFAGLLQIGKTITATGGTKDEEGQIDIYVKRIVSDLPR